MVDGEIRVVQRRSMGAAAAKRPFGLQEQPEERQEARPEVLQGRIVAGMPLSQEQQRHIAKRFEELLGKRVALSCHVDPKQLAGVRVELNGYSYDGTLRGQLTVLHKMLTRPDEEVR